MIAGSANITTHALLWVLHFNCVFFGPNMKFWAATSIIDRVEYKRRSAAKRGSILKKSVVRPLNFFCRNCLISVPWRLLLTTFVMDCSDFNHADSASLLLPNPNASSQSCYFCLLLILETLKRESKTLNHWNWCFKMMPIRGGPSFSILHI